MALVWHYEDRDHLREQQEQFDFIGDPGRTRTCDPQIRNLVLYPAELRGLSFGSTLFSASHTLFNTIAGLKGDKPGIFPSQARPSASLALTREQR